MTSVTVAYEGDWIQRLSCEGHAGCEAAGENIVCAAVSVLMETCVNAVEKIAKVQPLTIVDESKALISITLPSGDRLALHDAQTILRTTVLGLTDISHEYPKLVRLRTINGRK